MANNSRWWRWRLRIYTTELVADTHPDLDPDAPLTGEYRSKGTAAMFDEVSAMLHGFHDVPLESMAGARLVDLIQRTATLRVYLSARGGRADLRIPYTPDGNSAAYAMLTVERDDG
jgi:hypothetical protein